MRVLAFLISPQAQRFILTAGVVTEADGREGTSLVSGNITMVIQHPSPYLEPFVDSPGGDLVCASILLFD